MFHHRKRLLLAGIAAIGLCVTHSAQAVSHSFSFKEGHRAATVDFSTSGSDLVVKLTNTSVYDARRKDDILTSVFFDFAPDLDPTLTPVSAVLGSNSTVLFGSDGGGNVGGEWGFSNDLLGTHSDWGISSSSLHGAFRSEADFNGPDLNHYAGLGSIGYGLTSDADNPFTGTRDVRGALELIQSEIIFTLAGLPEGFDPLADITGAAFNYGDCLWEFVATSDGPGDDGDPDDPDCPDDPKDPEDPKDPPCPPNDPDCPDDPDDPDDPGDPGDPGVVPEPMTTSLLAIATMALVGHTTGRRRRNAIA